MADHTDDTILDDDADVHDFNFDNEKEDALLAEETDFCFTKETRELNLAMDDEEDLIPPGDENVKVPDLEYSNGEFYESEKNMSSSSDDPQEDVLDLGIAEEDIEDGEKRAKVHTAEALKEATKEVDLNKEIRQSEIDIAEEVLNYEEEPQEVLDETEIDGLIESIEEYDDKAVYSDDEATKSDVKSAEKTGKRIISLKSRRKSFENIPDLEKLIDIQQVKSVTGMSRRRSRNRSSRSRSPDRRSPGHRRRIDRVIVEDGSKKSDVEDGMRLYQQPETSQNTSLTSTSHQMFIQTIEQVMQPPQPAAEYHQPYVQNQYPVYQPMVNEMPRLPPRVMYPPQRPLMRQPPIRPMMAPGGQMYMQPPPPGPMFEARRMPQQFRQVVPPMAQPPRPVVRLNTPPPRQILIRVPSPNGQPVVQGVPRHIYVRGPAPQRPLPPPQAAYPPQMRFSPAFRQPMPPQQVQLQQLPQQQPLMSPQPQPLQPPLQQSLPPPQQLMQRPQVQPLPQHLQPSSLQLQQPQQMLVQRPVFRQSYTPNVGYPASSQSANEYSNALSASQPPPPGVAPEQIRRTIHTNEVQKTDEVKYLPLVREEYYSKNESKRDKSERVETGRNSIARKRRSPTADLTSSKQLRYDSDDEEFRIYKQKVEEQKQLREKYIQIKEEHRLKGQMHSFIQDNIKGILEKRGMLNKQKSSSHDERSERKRDTKPRHRSKSPSDRRDTERSLLELERLRTERERLRSETERSRYELERLKSEAERVRSRAEAAVSASLPSTITPIITPTAVPAIPAAPAKEEPTGQLHKIYKIRYKDGTVALKSIPINSAGVILSKKLATLKAQNPVVTIPNTVDSTELARRRLTMTKRLQNVSRQNKSDLIAESVRKGINQGGVSLAERFSNIRSVSMENNDEAGSSRIKVRRNSPDKDEYRTAYVRNIALSTKPVLIHKMACTCGIVLRINWITGGKESNQAKITFSKPEEARKFSANFNRKMFDRSQLSVSLIPDK